MHKDYIDKFCLGTAQFGLEYGIANNRGKPRKEEIFEMLMYAHNAGLDTLDTAYAYGDSENAIGEFMSQYRKKFKVISKIPYFDGAAGTGVEQHCIETLKRLKQDRLYGYLVHQFDNIISRKDLLKDVESLKSRGLVDKIGFSLYKPEELDYILGERISFDIIELPYNILDRRFESYFSVLKEKKYEIYIRSIFLQGLFFLDMNKIERDFRQARNVMEKLRNISRDCGLPVHALCLGFVALNSCVDRIIMGVDSLSQLKDNLDSLEQVGRVESVYDSLRELKFEDEKVLVPYNWEKK